MALSPPPYEDEEQPDAVAASARSDVCSPDLSLGHLVRAQQTRTSLISMITASIPIGATSPWRTPDGPSRANMAILSLPNAVAPASRKQEER